MKIRYISNSLKNQLFLPNSMVHNFEVVPRRVILNIGSWKREVEVEFSEYIEPDFIGISKYMLNEFTLPDTLIYEIKIEGRNLHIGPVIAFLLEDRKKYLPEDRLERLKSYYTNYKDIKGAIFICAVDQINTANRTIEGFYYDGDKWDTAVFPYPGCLYRKADIPDDIYNDLINYMGDKVFNSYFFDKWETWQLLSPYPSIREHIPHTDKLEGFETLEKMLKEHNQVYLKQTRGYKAKGIYKVEKTEEGYSFTTRLKGTTIIQDSMEVDKFLKDLNYEKRGKNFYIVQQAINVKKYQNRSYDFRVVFQKGSNKEWGCSGIIARFGKRGSIATNFLLAGYALTGYEALKRVFKMSEREAFVKHQEIIDVCTDTCKVLEKSIGNYGDLGIDVMIDENKKVWILEINKTHDHRFPLYSIENVQMYHNIITKPFEYAKALCGF